MNSKKIIFVITDLNYGGAEKQTVDIAIELKKREWDIKVFSLMPISPNKNLTKLQEYHIPVKSLNIVNLFTFIKSIPKFVSHIKEYNPIIIHSHMFHAIILARLTKLFNPNPLIISTIHITKEHKNYFIDLFRIYIYKLTDVFCNLTTNVSISGYKRYLEKGITTRDKIIHIPNGIDINLFNPDSDKKYKLRKEFKIEEKDFLWLAIGRFSREKDYPTMLKAFSYLYEENGNTKLFIIGEGQLKEKMIQLSWNLKIDKAVIFAGSFDNIPEIINIADGYLMSSEWEAMPLTLMEASANEIPIVATDVGDNSKIVINGITGFLVPPKNPEALADSMKKLMSMNYEERNIMGKKARKHIEENFSLPKIIDIWEKTYLELIQNNKIK